jgi:hypothetical protein
MVATNRSRTTEEADVPPTALMRRAMEGDRAAFVELESIAEAQGLPAHHYHGRWCEATVKFKLQDRAGKKDLLARAGIERVVERVEGELAEPGDGPIERLIIGRAALCAADTSLSERDYQYAAGAGGAAAPIEALDRRRERSQRMLLTTLKTLAAVRRMNRPVVKVNVGDGNLNVLNG